MYNSSSGWTLGCSKHVEDTIIKLKHWCKILCILLVHITLVYHTAMVKKRKGTERILTASWAVSHCRRAISWTSRYCPLGKMATLSWCQTELLQYLFCYQVDFIKNRKTERWKLWTEWIWILLLLLLSLLYDMDVSCHRHFFLVLLLNQRWSPPLRLQASHCSTFRIMCDVQSVAIFCSESIECFPGTASKFFLKLLVTIPVAPILLLLLAGCTMFPLGASPGGG